METKIQKQFVDHGFGFPIYLLNVPMIKVRGKWTPNIKYNALSDLILDMLAKKPSFLTGNEIKFIRTKLNYTLEEFAELFYVSHPAVIKWEKRGDEPTEMNWATEKDIRLFIASINPQNKKFINLYKDLRVVATNKKSKTKVDLKEEKLIAS